MQLIGRISLWPVRIMQLLKISCCVYCAPSTTWSLTGLMFDHLYSTPTTPQETRYTERPISCKIKWTAMVRNKLPNPSSVQAFAKDNVRVSSFGVFQCFPWVPCPLPQTHMASIPVASPGCRRHWFPPTTCAFPHQSGSRHCPISFCPQEGRSLSIRRQREGRERNCVKTASA